jgi:hypothetical protein
MMDNYHASDGEASHGHRVLLVTVVFNRYVRSIITGMEIGVQMDFEYKR